MKLLYFLYWKFMLEEIVEKLKQHFNPNDIVELVYEWVRWPTDEHKHYHLKVRSEKFDWKSKVQRHQMIYGIVNDYLRDGSLHALIMDLKTFKEVK